MHGTAMNAARASAHNFARESALTELPRRFRRSKKSFGLDDSWAIKVGGGSSCRGVLRIFVSVSGLVRRMARRVRETRARKAGFSGDLECRQCLSSSHL